MPGGEAGQQDFRTSNLMTNNIIGTAPADCKGQNWWDRPTRERDGEGKKVNRSRRVSFGPAKVTTDGQGNILEMPLTGGLNCFADPVEYLFGRTDTVYTMTVAGGKTVERPWNCGGCGRRAACATVADERLETSPTIKPLFDEWESRSSGMAPADKFKHPTFKPLREAIEATTWSNSNVAALEAHRKEEAQRKKRARKEQIRAKRRTRVVPADIVAALEAERDRRAAVLLAASQLPNAKLKLRNLPPERCQFTADVWLAEELLTREGQKASGGKIAERLAQMGRMPTEIAASSHPTRVNEALKRCRFLEEADDGPPMWSEFEEPAGDAPAAVATGMVVEMLEPD